jgi:hypothetical protein
LNSSDPTATYRYLVDQIVDSIPLGGYNATTTASQISGDGTYYIHVQAKNAAGNESSVTTVSAILDNTAPVITIANPTTAPAQNKTITASASDGTFSMANTIGSICDVTLPFIAYTSQTFTSESDNGAKVCYRAVDAAGNAAYSLSAAIAGIDATGPTIAGLTTDTAPTKSKTWSWSSELGVTFRFVVDTNASSTLSGDYDSAETAIQPSGNGTYYLHVQAKDAAGNESSIVTVSAILDNTAPVITITGDNPATVTQGSAYIDAGATATDNIDANDTVVSSGSVHTPTVGDYTITYNTSDAAGNAAVSQTRTVHVIVLESLAISSVIARPGSDSASIIWTTNRAASSQVEYGLVSSYGNITDESDTGAGTVDHEKIISGLVPCVTYHFRVKSSDALDNDAAGSDNTFTTSGCAGSASVLDQTAGSVIPVSGGALNLDSGSFGITLTVPAAFSDSAAEFQIKQLDDSSVLAAVGLPSGYQSASDLMYDLKSLTGFGSLLSSFDNSPTVSFSYDPSLLDNIDESTLAIFRWDGSVWSQLSGCNINRVIHAVSCATTGFSVFGLFGQPAQSASVSTTTIAVPSAVAHSGSFGQYNLQFLLAKIEMLKQQIKQVRQRLRAATPAVISTPVLNTTCLITKTLSYGLQNDPQVKCLQEFLKTQGASIYPEAKVTGNFFDSTKAAVIRFQEKHAGQILVSAGLVAGNGVVGSYTNKAISKVISTSSK